jgi:uncharacterized phage protein (TIGR01671 family)
MKDLKLRAWHKIEEKMCEVDLIGPGHGAFLIGVIPEEDQVVGKFYIESQKNGRYCLDFEFELIQFTGLKDKEGTEIYSGDIFRIEEDDSIFYVVITWINEWCMFASLLISEYHEYVSSGIEALDEPMFWTYTLEDTDSKKHYLCGNIYKNPELLNKQS